AGVFVLSYDRQIRRLVGIGTVLAAAHDRDILPRAAHRLRNLAAEVKPPDLPSTTHDPFGFGAGQDLPHDAEQVREHAREVGRLLLRGPRPRDRALGQALD